MSTRVTKRSISAVVVVFAIAGIAFGENASYTVSIQDGVTPRMSPSGVAEYVRSAASNARAAETPEVVVTSVECTDGVSFRAQFSSPELQTGAPIWTVRVSGRFVNHRVPQGVKPSVGTSAFYVVDDATGEVVSYGIVGGGGTRAPLDSLKREP